MADNLDTPYSRREIFYKGILDQDPDSLPEPQTREERYLKAIAEAYPTPVDAPVVQGEGSSTTSVMSQKAVSDALNDLRNNKLDKTGTAPLADNLTPYSADSGATQSVPFIAQGTGCGNGESIVDTGSYAQVKKKLGNTASVNQLIPIPTNSLSKTENGVTFTDNRDGTYTVQTTAEGATADTYITVYDKTTDHAGRTCILFGTPSGASATTHFLSDAMGSIGRDTGMGVIGNVYSNGRVIIRITVKSGAIITTPVTYRPKLCDLDIWYGSHGNIPSHLLSHPEDFGRHYSGSLAANPGQLVNADGSVLTSIGRNVWDEEWELGSYNSNNGEPTADATRIRSKNYVRIIPNTDYYAFSSSGLGLRFYDAQKNFLGSAYNSVVTNQSFRTPSEAAYLRFSVVGATTYNHDITISLYYPGESGYDQYYPYSVLAQIGTGSEVLRSAGSVADEKTPDGTITRRVGEPVTLDLSTMTFTQEGAGGTAQWYSTDQPFVSYKKPATNWDRANAQSGRFVCMAYTSLASGSGFGITSTGRLGISNDIYTNRAAYTSVEFFCEAATPTTEQGTPFSGASADNFAIDDFGSMYWTQSAGVPQGAEIFYPYDYKATVDTLLNMVSGDVEELVTETELGAVADRIPEAPAEDGTYTLKATVADGVKTYAWVIDE